MSCSDPRGSFFDWHGDDFSNILDQLQGSLLDGHGAAEGLDSVDDIMKIWDQPGAETAQFETSPEYALSKHLQPPHQGETSQIGTPPNHAVSNHGSMHVQPPQLAQQHGTSQSSNITIADAERDARIRQSKRKSWVKKEEKRRENEEKVAELDKQNHDLRKINATLVKEVVEAKVKQQNVEQQLRYCKEEVISRLKKKLRGQTMQVDVLSEKLVARHEATDVAEENKQLKRKIELLTTNNPDIIKTVELQEENEKLKREVKKLRILNDALCVKLSEDEQ